VSEISITAVVTRSTSVKQVWMTRAKLDAARYMFKYFVTDNKSKFTINTRQKVDLHHSLSNLLLYAKGMYPFDIKLTNF